MIWPGFEEGFNTALTYTLASSTTLIIVVAGP